MFSDWPHSKLSDPRQSGSAYLIFQHPHKYTEPQHSRSTKHNYGRLIYRKGLGHASQIYCLALSGLETWIRMESLLITRGAATTYPTSSESIPRQAGLCIVINILAFLIQGGAIPRHCPTPIYPIHPLPWIAIFVCCSRWELPTMTLRPVRVRRIVVSSRYR